MKFLNNLYLIYIKAQNNNKYTTIWHIEWKYDKTPKLMIKHNYLNTENMPLAPIIHFIKSFINKNCLDTVL